MLDERKSTILKIGDQVRCVKSSALAVIGTTEVVSHTNIQIYSLLVGNGLFQVIPNTKMITKLYIPPRQNNDSIPYVTSRFPLGESYVKVTAQVGKDVTIYYRYNGDSSLFELANFVNALRILGAENLQLVSPYFPGCRSDRVNDDNPGEALSSKVYAQFVNSLGFKRVTIFDPHSDVTPVALDYVRVVSNKQFVASVLKLLDEPEAIFVSPDAGANKKIDSLVKKVTPGSRVIRADKKRDVQTGALVPNECVVYANEGELQGKTCIIVDDICSRGGTFKTLAKELKSLGVVKIFCIFSHYENTADQESLKEAGITKVFTTDSLVREDVSNEFLHIFNIEQFLTL